MEYGIRLTVTFLIQWSALSGERTGLSFVYTAGPCQRSLSRVLVPWDLRPYFTASDLRLPFSSPPTTRRVTVEVFDPASTRVAYGNIIRAWKKSWDRCIRSKGNYFEGDGSQMEKVKPAFLFRPSPGTFWYTSYGQCVCVCVCVSMCRLFSFNKLIDFY
jgi:hypothetical protein